MAHDARDPGRAFGFFTVVAALDVVAARILPLPAGLPILGATGAVVPGSSYLLWSMVFPLGMYSTASMTFGGVTGRIGTGVATLAWLAALTLAARAAVRHVHAERRGREPPPAVIRRGGRTAGPAS